MYIYFFEQRAKLLLFCGVFRNCLIIFRIYIILCVIIYTIVENSELK